jgi:hypothetical protein
MRVLAVMLAAAVVASAASAAPRSYEFGRSGGSIIPFSVTIAVDGTVSVSGPVRVSVQRISPAGMVRLVAALRQQRFWGLPATTRCEGTLPDIAAEFITVHTGTATHSVLVHGDCVTRFNALYDAITRAVGLRYGTG